MIDMTGLEDQRRDDLIRRTLTEPCSAAGTAAVLARVEAALAPAKVMLKAESAESINPRLSAPTQRDHHDRAELLTAHVERLKAACVALGTRAANLAKERPAKLAEGDLALAERNGLAAELVATYPNVRASILDLLERLASNDRRLMAVRRDCEFQGDLTGAEALARNWKRRPDGFGFEGDPAPLAAVVQLPEL